MKLLAYNRWLLAWLFTCIKIWLLINSNLPGIGLGVSFVFSIFAIFFSIPRLSRMKGDFALTYDLRSAKFFVLNLIFSLLPLKTVSQSFAMLFAYHFNCYFAGSGERTERRLKRKKRVNNVIPLFRRPFRRYVHTYIHTYMSQLKIVLSSFFLFFFP